MEQLSEFRTMWGCRSCRTFIGALTLGIAGIGLMNIMLVAVQQRTREIGIEKALGARKWQIPLEIFVGSAGNTGIGGVAGILLAYTVSLGSPPDHV